MLSVYLGQTWIQIQHIALLFKRTIWKKFNSWLTLCVTLSAQYCRAYVSASTCSLSRCRTPLHKCQWDASTLLSWYLCALWLKTALALRWTMYSFHASNAFLRRTCDAGSKRNHKLKCNQDFQLRIWSVSICLFFSESKHITFVDIH